MKKARAKESAVHVFRYLNNAKTKAASAAPTKRWNTSQRRGVPQARQGGERRLPAPNAAGKSLPRPPRLDGAHGQHRSAPHTKQGSARRLPAALCRGKKASPAAPTRRGTRPAPRRRADKAMRRAAPPRSLFPREEGGFGRPDKADLLVLIWYGPRCAFWLFCVVDIVYREW